jgi:hypothetical protein
VEILDDRPGEPCPPPDPSGVWDTLYRLCVRPAWRRPALLGRHGAEVLPGPDGLDGLAELGDRLLQMAGLSQGVAEVTVSLGVIRLEPEGRAVRGDGLLQPARVGQGDAEVVVGAGAQRPQGRGSSVIPNRFLQVITPEFLKP